MDNKIKIMFSFYKLEIINELRKIVFNVSEKRNNTGKLFTFINFDNEKITFKVNYLFVRLIKCFSSKTLFTVHLFENNDMAIFTTNSETILFFTPSFSQPQKQKQQQLKGEEEKNE